MFLRTQIVNYTRFWDSYENLWICCCKAKNIYKARKYFSTSLKYNPRSHSTLLELTEIEIEEHSYLDASALPSFHC